MSAPEAVTPVLTIGGYLGSGKTTLVNHLLRNANGRRLAVLVNEFGDLPIDEDLIEATSDELISIAGGCICCSFGDDLMGALQDMRQLSPPPDHIIIESSGVAIPGAIVATMSLLSGFRSDGIAVVIDAETVRKHAQNDYIGDTIMRQLSDAEFIVVNKLDLVSADTATALTEWLGEVAPNAIQTPSQFGQVLPEAILGVVAAPGKGAKAQHSDKLFESCVLSMTAPTDAKALAEKLATGDLGVIRAKGYLHGSDGALWLIQTVGKRWEAHPVDDQHNTGIVCLGFRGQIDVEAIARLPEKTSIN
ncbi:MAG: CobW family GTP-binding protein [Pikeienuella sp.]